MSSGVGGAAAAKSGGGGCEVCEWRLGGWGGRMRASQSGESGRMRSSGLYTGCFGFSPLVSTIERVIG